METSKPAVQIIDEVRGAYSRNLVDRAAALDRIMNTGLALTEEGAAEVLDHEQDLGQRYVGHGDCPDGCGSAIPSNRAERRRAAKARR